MAENSDPPVLTYMFQRNVEIPPSPSAQGCRCPLGQRPLRGRCQRTPSHVAGDPGKGDTERSILDACRNKYSCQLINHALPGAGHETPTVYFAFSHPFAAVIRSSGFFERTAMDRERICHGKSVFKGPETRRSDFPVTGFGKPFPCSGDQRTQEASEIGGIGKWPAYRAQAFRPSQRRSDALPNAREPSCPDLLRNEPWVGRQLTSQKGGRLTKSERCARSTRSRRTCGALNHGCSPLRLTRRRAAKTRRATRGVSSYRGPS